MSAGKRKSDPSVKVPTNIDLDYGICGIPKEQKVYKMLTTTQENNPPLHK